MCDCLVRTNSLLTDTNTALVYGFRVKGPSVAVIAVCKRDSRKREKPVNVYAAYCPFCGEKYPE